MMQIRQEQLIILFAFSVFAKDFFIRKKKEKEVTPISYRDEKEGKILSFLYFFSILFSKKDLLPNCF